jgi:hypothetical protein
MKFLKLNIFSTTKCHIQNTKEIDDSIDSKSKPLCSANISTYNIDNEINNSHPINHVTKKINIEHYYLFSNFVI